MGSDPETQRIRRFMLMRANCETILGCLDEDAIDDLALAIQIGEPCDTSDSELGRFAKRRAQT